MVSKILTIFCIIGFISCVSTKLVKDNASLLGAYWNQEDGTIFSISKDNTFIYKNSPNQGDLALYTCCDTISFGVWRKLRGDILEVSTPEYLNIPITKIQVQELESDIKKSIEFIIESPIEEFYKNNPSNRRAVRYQIELVTNDIQFELSQVNKLYDDNKIIINIPERIRIEGFIIEIIPTSFFGGQNMGHRRWSTLKYDIQDKKATKFMVKLPDMSYDYLSYLRLEKDYILLKNKDILLWNNKEYKRK